MSGYTDKGLDGRYLRENDDAEVIEALVAERDRLREALEVADDLLRNDGYHVDPDYVQKWLIIHDALAAGTEPT